ncbi:hypothetical protein NL676_007424 [Syzygium grande]|nr:hypothetical protein NL676_007424 [Syzygium grande]
MASGALEVAEPEGNGKNVSNFFPQVVKNVASQSLEVKKLVYLYLLHYAEKGVRDCFWVEFCKALLVSRYVCANRVKEVG